MENILLYLNSTRGKLCKHDYKKSKESKMIINKNTTNTFTVTVLSLWKTSVSVSLIQVLLDSSQTCLTEKYDI